MFAVLRKTYAFWLLENVIDEIGLNIFDLECIDDLKKYL